MSLNFKFYSRDSFRDKILPKEFLKYLAPYGFSIWKESGVIKLCHRGLWHTEHPWQIELRKNK